MDARILYIEDNEQNFYLVNVLLKMRAYEVHWARNGQDGIEMAKLYKPDLILLDIQLPIMDGYEVARKLRSNPELCNIPIVALTSYAMTGDREKALEAGCTGYIEKPLNPDTFIAQVNKYLTFSESSRDKK